jgi:mono/diheme cytochrome c family protein
MTQEPGRIARFSLCWVWADGGVDQGLEFTPAVVGQGVGRKVEGKILLEASAAVGSFGKGSFVRPGVCPALAWTVGLFVGTIFLLGCTPPPQFRENRLEWYKQERAARLEPGQSFAGHHFQDVADVTTAWFGTPDEVFLPLISGPDDPVGELLDRGRLQRAAGAVKSRDERSSEGLYRRHCAHCHGVTGDGAGPTAAFLSPYPRDFRLGKFKFKSSSIGTPPSKEDLKTLLVNGVPGTSMPSFRLLSDEELESLSDYVIYLSLRGSVERLLIAAVKDLGDDERLVALPAGVRRSAQASVGGSSASGSSASESSASGSSASESAAAGPAAAGESPAVVVGAGDDFDPAVLEEELLYLADDHLTPMVEKWLGILDYEPKAVAMPDWVGDRGHPAYAAQVDVGRKLYFGPANCVQCHGETGLGDGQTNNYDDWTNDWLKVEGIDPSDPQAWAAYVNAGAHPPRPILPRNLRMGVYRGGDRPIDIFRRIQYGIEGTPMPASLTLTEEQIWALVVYVQQLPYEPLSRPETSQKLANDRPVR